MVYLRRFLSKIAEMRVNFALSDPDTTSLNRARSNVKLCKFELKHSSVQNAKNIVFFSLGRIQRLRSLTHSTGMLIIRSSKHETKAPSTRIRIFLNPKLFLSGYGYRPHAYGEFARKSGNFLIRTPEWKLLNPITFRIRVDGRIRILSDTMTSQNWRKCLPRKYGRRSKAKSFCAPWAYFQSFSLYAAKCHSTKCWNKLCQKAARHLQALYVIYRTKRPAETT